MGENIYVEDTISEYSLFKLNHFFFPPPKKIGKVEIFLRRINII